MFRAPLSLWTCAAFALLALLPFAPAQACSTTGALGELMRYAGTMRGEIPTTLDSEPVVEAHLRRLSVATRALLKRNLDVRGPVDLVSCHLVVSGNANHMGGNENAILDINLYSGAVTVAILSRGRIDIYLDTDSTAGTGYAAQVPPAVRWWAVMATTGFQAAEAPPKNSRLIRPQR